MIVLTTSTSSQSFNFIPRTGTQPTVMLITDEETNTTGTDSPCCYSSGAFFCTGYSGSRPRTAEETRPSGGAA